MDRREFFGLFGRVAAALTLAPYLGKVAAAAPETYTISLWQKRLFMAIDYAKADQWQHIAGVFENGRLVKTYCNGCVSEITEDQRQLLAQYLHEPMEQVHRTAPHGIASDVATWDRNLEEDQVHVHYATGLIEEPAYRTALPRTPHLEANHDRRRQTDRNGKGSAHNVRILGQPAQGRARRPARDNAYRRPDPALLSRGR